MVRSLELEKPIEAVGYNGPRSMIIKRVDLSHTMIHCFYFFVSGKSQEDVWLIKKWYPISLLIRKSRANAWHFHIENSLNLLKLPN